MPDRKVIKLETDYLVVGCGAMSIAFVDEILHSGSQAEIILVDKHAKPGGHWNDAYQFVTLHQPAAYYGVNSKQLGEGGEDLVSKSQILAYYELVMKDFLATNRVKFFSLCEYLGDNRFKSLVDHDVEYEVTVRKKTVDGTYMNVEVPSITKPKFNVDSDVPLVPVNGIADIRSPWEKYVVLGAGKTGIDAVLFLLSQNVDPDNITWIMPNDAWLMNRDTLQPSVLEQTTFGMLNIIIREDVKTQDDIFRHYEKQNYVMRIDEKVEPKIWKCATVSSAELVELRKIKNIVRKGRIESIEKDKIVFKNKSEIPTSVKYLHVNCTSNGLGKRPKVPVFNGNQIYLQSIYECQQVASAAMIGALEGRYSGNDELLNKMCDPCPHPETPRDYPISAMTGIKNLDSIGSWEGLGFNWMRSNRLCMMYHMSFMGLCKFIMFDMMNKKKMNEKLELLILNASK